MSVIIALIPLLAVGIPVAIADGLAQAVGLQLIDKKAVEANRQKRIAELTQKKRLTLLQKKELKLLQLGESTNTVKEPVSISPAAGKSPTLTIPTRMRNAEFLLRALKELGTQNVIQENDKLVSGFANLSISYLPDTDGYIGLHFNGTINAEEAKEFAGILESQYGKLLQEAVYTQLKQKAENKGLKLEEEYIEEDDTIVLTYNAN